MHIPLTEPTAPRYITINQETNQVHLMVPVVSGQEISTDNTCKATVALREFFDGGALRELNAYKDALVFDILLLEEENPQRIAKEARLAQIGAYLEAVQAMQYSPRDAMTALMTRPSNLYSIQLRPREQDRLSNVVNPAFNIERKNDASGKPQSAMYNAMQVGYPSIMIGQPDPRARVTSAILSALPASSSFTDIQRVLTEKFHQWLGLEIDFTQQTNSTPATKDAIDALMGFDEDSPATPQDYVDALLGFCAPDVWGSIPTPPFYSIPAGTAVDERTERLSILTQFFLGIVNIYCKARGISVQNFGAVLDASNDLSTELVRVVSEVLSRGDGVEEPLCAFCNDHATEFGLSRALKAADVATIKQKFERTYLTVTATKENPHMDDFMILDCDATGEAAKFVTHQGAICTDFAEIVEPTLANQDYFARIREEFAGHPAEIPHKNEWVAGDVDIEPEALLARITDEQFEKMPDAVKVACRAHPTFQMRQFLPGVAKGKQNEADALLTASSGNKQVLLRTPGVFTDYSGRTFNCTAYEYAYWAKDTHMCRMLERHMDDETKAYMLARIDEIERLDEATGQPIGLVYSQAGQEHRSAHFGFTPLKEAYQRYLAGYDAWSAAQNWDAMKAAWMEVGIAQRDMPVHVVNEYCHPDRSFSPRPEFNE
ncbi:MAG: hypothetical protein NTW94_03270, partial [Legionellales bacterium]|nr:hypothetical protein [Legionellales bacterium]